MTCTAKTVDNHLHKTIISKLGLPKQIRQTTLNSFQTRQQSQSSKITMSSSAPLTASQEDYLETIYNIVEKNQVARAKEIANQLKVSRSSVTEAFRALAKKGLINYKPYEVITLTPKGNRNARDVIRRHKALKEFFVKVLAVEDKIAESGACRIEHAAPREIIERIIQLVDFIEENSEAGKEMMKNFNLYCQSNPPK